MARFPWIFHVVFARATTVRNTYRTLLLLYCYCTHGQQKRLPIPLSTPRTIGESRGRPDRRNASQYHCSPRPKSGGQSVTWNPGFHHGYRVSVQFRCCQKAGRGCSDPHAVYTGGWALPVQLGRKSLGASILAANGGRGYNVEGIARILYPCLLCWCRELVRVHAGL